MKKTKNILFILLIVTSVAQAGPLVLEDGVYETPQRLNCRLRITKNALTGSFWQELFTVDPSLPICTRNDKAEMTLKSGNVFFAQVADGYVTRQMYTNCQYDVSCVFHHYLDIIRVGDVKRNHVTITVISPRAFLYQEDVQVFRNERDIATHRFEQDVFSKISD